MQERVKKMPFFAHCRIYFQHILREKLLIDKKNLIKHLMIVHQQMHTPLKTNNFKAERSLNCSVTFHVSPKKPISQEKMKITSTKIKILTQNFFLSSLVKKQSNLYIFFKFFFLN